MIYKNNTQKNRGYTLLFSVLVSSLLLTIGLAILTISKKELLLSSAGRESQFAFYAADTGVECAMYYDIGAKGGEFSSKAISAPSDIKCNNQNIAVTRIDGKSPPTGSGADLMIRFIFDIPLDRDGSESSPCASVTVDKLYSGIPLLKTVIQSRGYNTGCGVKNDPKKLERGLRVSY
ncbi:MAG: pilus assembly PilX N-terminal domain-containing protein [Patescibacteria group bacterium]|nr:pilus assembly PilX N-terminal domain-containing protein [Patescibacteria group bacterium]